MKLNNKKLLTFTKKIIVFILFCSELQIFLSYLLAFMDKTEIAQELSSNIVTVCLGSVGFYIIKSLIENINKYSKKTNKEEVQG